ncbi:GNAT family N-acetyltransferase [Streptacidiphilus sp. PB12-B1b]|uniref:GNAT family N-acetyltransferase n=1 Tax=Streptacidiphilus sp. PB12-B1b TaxID=2705012 RepID=UPI0015FABCF1|nr:GNAT family N-acetyltransferase [Streptacidiphilus sp. PB12-B1b]QMU79373.1 GNAT family N-acetyltransferase [Streptacidiphilus sp. PB12-B1b]
MSEQAAVREAVAQDVDAAVRLWTLSHVVRRNGRPLPEAHIASVHRRMATPGALLLLARCPADDEPGAPGAHLGGGDPQRPGADRDGRVDAGWDGGVHDPGSAGPGAVVGTILGLQGLDRDGAGPPVPGLLHISQLSVAPDRWGQHIGRQLVEQVLIRASARGFEQAQLWTHADNLRANRLYKSMGFRRSGRVRIDDWGELLVHYRRAVRG